MLKRITFFMMAAVLSTASVHAAVYNISAVGNAAITSITGTNASTVYNNGTAPVTTTAANGVGIIMNFSGVINNLAQFQPGDQITIPITIASASHFTGVGLSFNSSLGGIFTVRQDGNGSILLTATSAISGSGGAFSFNLSGTGTLWTTGVPLANLSATTTTYTVNGNSWTINNSPLPLTASNACNTAPTGAATTRSNDFSIYYQINCIYNQLLLNGASSLTNPALNSNFIEVATIPASSQILSITWGSATPTSYMNFVMPDNSSMSGINVTSFGGAAAFSAVSIPANASMAQIQAAMQPGQRAMVQNSDGSYTIAIDWGPLLNNIYTQYAPGTSVASYDANTNTLMQAAITDNLSALQNRLYLTLTFADPTIQNSVPLTVTSNITSLLSSGSGTLTNTPLTNAVAGQTAVKIHYVTLKGFPLQTVASTYGYPAGNALGEPTAAPVQAAPASIPGYRLVTDAAILDTITSIPASGILTGNSAIAYPSSGTIDVYYVYAPVALPITLLQFAAQAQGKTALLTWTTTTEINNKGFNIQRSADAQAWSNIGFVNSQAANGNSSVSLNYSFTDNTPAAGINYYRIQETDLNGNTAFSSVKSIDFGIKATIYPNPASSQLNISVAANSSYRLIDILGRTVLTGNLQAGNNMIYVNSIPAGIYLLRVTTGNNASVYKVVVQR